MLDYGEYIIDEPYRQYGNGYDQLDGEWFTYYKVARYFVHKVKREDREDFLHDLMLEMAKVKAKYQAKDKPLTEAGLMRVASYQVTEYWHTLMRHRPTMLSFNGRSGDGDFAELIDYLADDTAIDLDLKLDIRRFLLGCPRRIVQIGYKVYSGIRLTKTEQRYLNRYQQEARKKQQLALI